MGRSIHCTRLEALYKSGSLLTNHYEERELCLVLQLVEYFIYGLICVGFIFDSESCDFCQGFWRRKGIPLRV